MKDIADRDARLYLLRVAEYPSPRIHAYAAEHGVVRASSDIRANRAPADVLAEAHTPDISIADDIRLLDTGRAALLTPHDVDWPTAALQDLDDAERPLALWKRGAAFLSGLAAHAAAITGARAATSYGTGVASELAGGFAHQGVTIVNGGSYGIDEAALRAIVTVGGRAVVILPCGVDQAYPQANTTLFGSVIDNGGLLVSEYAPGCVPRRTRFAARARLIAALGSVVVIVEAGRRSGAFAVAQAAKLQGRTVLGVPGSIYSATSTGVHELIQMGVAQLVKSIDEIPT